LAKSYPRHSDCVAILDEDNFMTAAASFRDASSLPWTLKRAKEETPPEFIVSYVDTK
jgi:hypothetical protein